MRTFRYIYVAIRTVNSTTYAFRGSLITQRSLVQIQAPQPMVSLGLLLVSAVELILIRPTQIIGNPPSSALTEALQLFRDRSP